MSSRPGVAPLFSAWIATGAMTWTVVWGLTEVIGRGPSVTALLGLALLCAAFVLARVGPACSPIRAVASGIVAAAGIEVEIVAHDGRLGDPQIWIVCTAACIALLLIWRHQTIVACSVMLIAAVLTCLYGGISQLQDLGTLTIALVLAVIAGAGHVLAWYADQMRLYAESERDSIELRVVENAYQTAHQQRIGQTGRLAGTMLQEIVAAEGRLTSVGRAEARLLHQSIRDETRGRYLLNDAVREQVRTHRRRGAVVQLLDDGHLAELEPERLSVLLGEVAHKVTGLTSDRIVIRSQALDDAHSITVVATTTDPIAAALGEDDDQVDLWHQIKVERNLTEAV